jgi:hypothetical protein
MRSAVVLGGATATSHGIDEERSRQSLDVRGHRGREEQRLPLLRERGDDALHVGQKAHVEHAIGLVEHEDLDALEGERALPHQVEEAAWGGHHDVHAALELGDLGPFAHAAEDHRVIEVQAVAIARDARADLAGQLAGGGDDEPAQVGRIAGRHVEALEHGERERRRLASAGLRAAEDVAPLEGGRDGRLLDGGGLCVAFALDGAEKNGVEPQIGESHRAL